MMYPSVSVRSNGAIALTIAAIIVHLEDWAGVKGITLAPVYWNVSNPIFKTSKNDHIIVVNLFDEIDFVCPHYHQTTTDSTSLEYYLIYRVSKKEYDDCNIYTENTTFLILRCTHPRQKKRFTILFEPFQSIPNVPEYKAGHTYYFMSPSTGRKHGLRNLYQGACLQNNMKLTIKVREGGEYEVDDFQQFKSYNDTNFVWTDLENEETLGKEEEDPIQRSVSTVAPPADLYVGDEIGRHRDRSHTLRTSSWLPRHRGKGDGEEIHGLSRSNSRNPPDEEDELHEDDEAFLALGNNPQLEQMNSAAIRQVAPSTMTHLQYIFTALTLVLNRWHHV